MVIQVLRFLPKRIHFSINIISMVLLRVHKANLSQILNHTPIYFLYLPHNLLKLSLSKLQLGHLSFSMLLKFLLSPIELFIVQVIFISHLFYFIICMPQMLLYYLTLCFVLTCLEFNFQDVLGLSHQEVVVFIF